MYKTLLSTLLTGLLALIVTGCGGSTSQPKQVRIDLPCKQENVSAPSWACNPFAVDAYAGVGISKVSSVGMDHMRRIALANGRSSLFKQIKSQVKDKVEVFTLATGVSDAKTITKAKMAAVKQVAKVDLQSSKGIHTWVAPSGKLYMLVTVPQNSVNNEVKEVLKKQFQSKNALENLDKIFPTNKI